MNKTALRKLVRDRWLLALTILTLAAVALQFSPGRPLAEGIFWSLVLVASYVAVAWVRYRAAAGLSTFVRKLDLVHEDMVKHNQCVHVKEERR